VHSIEANGQLVLPAAVAAEVLAWPLSEPAWSITDLEVGVTVAERRPALADRHAAVGLALDAAVHGDELIGRPLDLDDAVHQDLAATVPWQ